MRGKITIAVILIGSLLFYWYAFWYFNSLSPADVRFNLNRQAATAAISQGDLFPKVVSNYSLKEGPTSTTDSSASGETALYTAAYTVADGTALQFSASQIQDMDAANKSLTADRPGCEASLHADAKIPYVYYSCTESKVYSFVWVNSSHRFEAQCSDEELLLRFVNAYSY